MSPIRQNIDELFGKITANRASDAEVQEFFRLLQESAHDEAFRQALDGWWGRAPVKETGEEARVRMYGEITRRKQSMRPILASLRIKWVAAAAILLLLSAGLYWWMQPAAVPVTAATDIAPGSRKAILILSDGSRMELDSAGNQVILQGSTTIRQQGGQLQYDARGASSGVSYNTLVIPRGGYFQVTLPDSSRVWLNAASSLRYPTAFNAGTREVEVTGEAYFEVKADARRPFRVRIPGQPAIDVLGTRFNVNAYTNEKQMAATLFEGSVRVGSATLRPGQQALIDKRQQLHIAGNIREDKVLAWKNGLFNFDDMSLREAMLQLERWYDIEVVYENAAMPDIPFSGEISRNVPLEGLLRMLARTTLKFRIENNRKLIITN